MDIAANPFLWAAGGLFLLFVYVVATFNRIARLKNHLRESWADVDVALKRRYDLIPNLVETVKAYAAHEQQLLTKITEARTRAMAAPGLVEHAQQENEMVLGLNGLLARVEAYPNLKASESFQQLQMELVDTEDRIAAARRFYNANVRDFNSLLASFPSGLVAKVAGCVEAPFFEVQDLAVRLPVRITASNL
ncbi:MAG: LemA family protein [Fimbriimonas ginsengisoli]|uniref:LemA family protein n=1 Tax=Fimbriimonas ginsengisoli TaxID=1005039 RepID=A0A931PV63_FIMGI|nr:LemA family protein [Fimbriimonas ginsengisoli]